MEQSENCASFDSRKYASTTATGIGMLAGITGLFGENRGLSFQSKLEARTWAVNQATYIAERSGKTIQEVTNEIYDTLKPYVDQLPDVLDRNKSMEESVERIMNTIMKGIEISKEQRKKQNKTVI